MADIFDRNTDIVVGMLQAEQARVHAPQTQDNSGRIVGLFMQQVRFDQKQQITRLFEVGVNRIYYVGGRTAWTVKARRTFISRSMTAAFYRDFGSRDRSGKALRFLTVSGTKRGNYLAKFCLIVAVPFSVSDGDMVINESMAMIFDSFLAE